MPGDPLRDLDGAARIHVLGDARRSEAVTTNSFSGSRWLPRFLNQFQDTPGDPGVSISMFRDFCRRKEKVEHLD
jgi:hypothetical protein